MQRKTVIRIILDVILFICAVLGLWWIIYPVSIFAVWSYRKFYELVFAGFILDVIYSTSRVHLLGFKYWYTLIALVIFLIVNTLKTRVRREIWQKNT